MADPRNPSSIPRIQGWLIARMKMLVPDADEKGICLGVASMGLQAFLSNDLKTYNQRLELINAIPVHNFVREIDELNAKRIGLIKQVKDKMGPLRELTENERNKLLTNEENKAAFNHFETNLKSLENLSSEEIQRRRKIFLFNLFVQSEIEAAKLNLTEDERIKFDIPIFLQGVHWYHDPLVRASTAEEAAISQHDLLTSKMITSTQLEKQGGVSKRRAFAGVYSVEELIQYFSLLKELVSDKSTGIGPLAFLFASGNHVITVGYNAETKQWAFTDANQLPTKYYSDASDVARYVIDGFMTKDLAIMSTTLFTREMDEDHWEPILSAWEKNNAWQAMHKITTEKAEITDGFGFSWLDITASIGRLDTADELLETGAYDAQLATSEGFNNVLFLAAFDGYTKLVDTLLARSAKVNHGKSCEIEINPLYVATQNGHVNVIKVLLGHKANPNQVCTATNKTPLYLAAERGMLNVVKALLDGGADPNFARSSDGATALHAAAKNGHHKIVKALLDRGASPNPATTDYSGVSPLFMAAQMGHLDTVNVLLDNGADPNQARISDGRTPLSFVVSYSSRVNVIKALLNKKADPNQAGKYGDPPLCTAAYWGNLDALTTLLEGGANPDQQASNGATALYIATKEGKTDMVKLLVQHHASPAATSTITADKLRELAQRHDKVEAMQALLIAKQADLLSLSVMTDLLTIVPGLLFKMMSSAIADSQNIKISPKEIAQVMGHGDIEKYLDEAEKKALPDLKGLVTGGLFKPAPATAPSVSPQKPEKKKPPLIT
jgi:ankyrin repeat protein